MEEKIKRIEKWLEGIKYANDITTKNSGSTDMRMNQTDKVLKIVLKILKGESVEEDLIPN